MSNPNDPVAEMKARAENIFRVWFVCKHDSRKVPELLAAFAAREVEWAIENTMKLYLVEQECRVKNQDALRKVDENLLRATEAERLENAQAVCHGCDSPELYEAAALRPGKSHAAKWMHKEIEDGTYIYCAAAPIWERAHGKGENND